MLIAIAPPNSRMKRHKHQAICIEMQNILILNCTREYNIT